MKDAIFMHRSIHQKHAPSPASSSSLVARKLHGALASLEASVVHLKSAADTLVAKIEGLVEAIKVLCHALVREIFFREKSAIFASCGLTDVFTGPTAQVRFGLFRFCAVAAIVTVGHRTGWPR